MTWEPKKFKQQEFVPLMEFLIEMYQPDVYVEVGIQRGYTFLQIAPLVKFAYGIDINLYRNLFLEFNTLRNCTFYESDSVTIGNNWKGPLIDLLFIDGDHSKNSVLADVDAFLLHITPYTGLILLHDTYPSSEYLESNKYPSSEYLESNKYPSSEYLESNKYCSTAWEAAKELHQNPKYKDVEIVTLPGPHAGLSILRKCPSGCHLHWRI